MTEAAGRGGLAYGSANFGLRTIGYLASSGIPRPITGLVIWILRGGLAGTEGGLMVPSLISFAAGRDSGIASYFEILRLMMATPGAEGVCDLD